MIEMICLSELLIGFYTLEQRLPTLNTFTTISIHFTSKRLINIEQKSLSSSLASSGPNRMNGLQTGEYKSFLFFRVAKLSRLMLVN